MPEKNWNLHNVMRATIGADCGMIFGNTGTGKSMLIRAVAQSAVEQNIKVAMCDTESNYTQEDIDWLTANTTYHRASGLQGIKKWIQGLETGFKVLILDSIGGPAYGEYTAAPGPKEKGNIFQAAAEIMYAVQKYCQDNDCMGLVVNQPTSDFAVGKEPKEGGPLLGKTNFYTKETIKMIKLPAQDGFSWSGMQIWKSRHMSTGFKFGKMEIGDKRIRVVFGEYQGRLAHGWPEMRCKLMNPLLSDEKETVTVQGGGNEETEPETKQENKPETKPESTQEMSVGEEDESSEEQLQSARTALNGLIDEKDISEELFAELAEKCSIEAKCPEQINDLQEALNLKSVIEKLPIQTKEKSKKDEDTFL